MKNNKEVKISYWAAHLTTVVSVTLVLVIIGIISLISIGAATETRKLRERLEVSVVMADNVTDSLASETAKVFEGVPYAHSVRMISQKEALQHWKDDTGEDLEALFGGKSPVAGSDILAECRLFLCGSHRFHREGDFSDAGS